MEEWKNIEGYEGLYQISNLGNIKSLVRKNNLKEFLLKPRLNNIGYLTVYLYKNNKPKNFKVHKLVAKAFLNNYNSNLVIDHIDENKLNNCVTNLQIITQRNNISKNKLTKQKSSVLTGVCWNKIANKWQSNITINGKKKHLGLFNTEEEAGNAYQKALMI